MNINVGIQIADCCWQEQTPVAVCATVVLMKPLTKDALSECNSPMKRRLVVVCNFVDFMKNSSRHDLLLYQVVFKSLVLINQTDGGRRALTLHSRLVEHNIQIYHTMRIGYQPMPNIFSFQVSKKKKRDTYQTFEYLIKKRNNSPTHDSPLAENKPLSW